MNRFACCGKRERSVWCFAMVSQHHRGEGASATLMYEECTFWPNLGCHLSFCLIGPKRNPFSTHQRDRSVIHLRSIIRPRKETKGQELCRLWGQHMRRGVSRYYEVLTLWRRCRRDICHRNASVGRDAWLCFSSRHTYTHVHKGLYCISPVFECSCRW
jgi:hypothetical protein